MIPRRAPQTRWAGPLLSLALVTTLAPVTDSGAGRMVAHRLAPTAVPRQAAGSVRSDFNGDGFADLAIGVPGESVGSVQQAGAVNVIYGSARRLRPTGVADQIWSQGSPSVEETPEYRDDFGSALATGDFNGDGFADLAVGSPGETLGSSPDAGAVSVIYGSGRGLSAVSVPDQLWTEDSPGIDEDPEPSDFFGGALAVGDFDGDGFADLAIGAPGESVTVAPPANFLEGAVSVIYGSGRGLSTATRPAQFWSQDSPGVGDQAEAEDFFGGTLAVGDFNGDGFADLAMGAPDERLIVLEEGGVNVVYGSSGGLSATAVPDQFWTQESPGVADDSEFGDIFGAALAASDFNGDGFADLAIGIPGEDVSGPVGDPGPSDGAVVVIHGTVRGLTAVDPPAQFWTQNSPAVEDAAEAGDGFGSALGSGDLNGDGFGDLAVGTPGETVGSSAGAGAVNVLHGSVRGLTATGPPDQLWDQDSPGIEGVSEPLDRFGAPLMIADFNGDGFGDLAAGVPKEDVVAEDDGGVNVIYGSVRGLSAVGVRDQFWSQDSAGVQEHAEVRDLFGDALGVAGSS